MRVLEKPITDSIISNLNKYSHVWVRKRHTTGMSGTIGWPDITGIIKLEINGLKFGIRIEIEVKKPGKKPTQVQYSRLRRFRKLGAITFWTDGLEDCMSKFELWVKITTGELGCSSPRDLLPHGPITIVKDL